RKPRIRLARVAAPTTVAARTTPRSAVRVSLIGLPFRQRRLAWQAMGPGRGPRRSRTQGGGGPRRGARRAAARRRPARAGRPPQLGGPRAPEAKELQGAPARAAHRGAPGDPREA